MTESQVSRGMTPDEIVEAAERADVVDYAITIPAMWPRLILERERASQRVALTEAYERGRADERKSLMFLIEHAPNEAKPEPPADPIEAYDYETEGFGGT